MSANKRRRLREDAHREFSAAISRYWDASEISVRNGVLQEAGLSDVGIIIRTPRFQLLITPPTHVGWNHWKAFLVDGSSILWRTAFNGHFSAIETTLIGLATALKTPTASLVALFAAARDSAVIAIQGKRGRFQCMKRLGMTLGEYALAFGVPADRVVLWHHRLGLSVPPSRVDRGSRRLIDEIRSMVEAGRSREIAESLGIRPGIASRAIRYLEMTKNIATAS